MSEGQNNPASAAAEGAVAATGLVGHIEHLFASGGDAALHGLRHLAGEIEKFAHGGVEPQAIEDLIGRKVAELVTPYLHQLQEIIQTRVEDLEHQVEQLLARVAGQPAMPAPEGGEPQPQTEAPAGERTEPVAAGAA